MQLLKVSIFVNMNTVVAKSRVFEVVECSCINEFRFVHLCVILLLIYARIIGFPVGSTPGLTRGIVKNLEQT